MDADVVCESKRRRRFFTKRFGIATVVSVIALCAFLVLAPLHYSQATDADLAGIMTPRDGYVWQGGTFEGVNVENGEITRVTADDRVMVAGPDFTIKRVLVQRSAVGIRVRLHLLELPDAESWNGYKGSRAWYECSRATGEVSYIIIVEKPR